MPVKSAGETYNLNDTCILQINSPRDSVRGPYVVAYHTPPDGERWAVVGLGLGWTPHAWNQVVLGS